MLLLDFNELKSRNINADIYDVFFERWKNSRKFTMYQSKPRPSDAIFFVCSDIKVSFFQMDNSAVIAQKGDAVWIPKGSLYTAQALGNSEDTFETYTVNLALTDEYGKKIGCKNAITVLTNRQDKMFDIHLHNLNNGFHAAEKESSARKHRSLKAKGELFLILDLIAESMVQKNDFYYPIRIGAELFCREWNKNKKIEEYATISDVSETYFYRCFRKWSGMSPIAYRNFLRLSNAASLLRSTDMQICEISKAVGFEDPFYFSRLFLLQYGLSPKKYRNQL